MARARLTQGARIPGALVFDLTPRFLMVFLIFRLQAFLLWFVANTAKYFGCKMRGASSAFIINSECLRGSASATSWRWRRSSCPPVEVRKKRVDEKEGRGRVVGREYFVEFE